MLPGDYFSSFKVYNKQKQLPEMFSKKRCFEKFHKVHRKTSVPESLFDKVAG